jgi:hemoglobin
MKELNEREDVALLVNIFYSKVKEERTLGPVFNALIVEENWPVHLIRMVDFWECNLFFRPTFKGNPMQAHRKVDANYNFKTNERHYQRWVELWCQTVDGHFEGQKAELAKTRAKNMGKLLLAKVMAEKPLFTPSV